MKSSSHSTEAQALSHGSSSLAAAVHPAGQHCGIPIGIIQHRKQMHRTTLQHPTQTFNPHKPPSLTYTCCVLLTTQTQSSSDPYTYLTFLSWQNYPAPHSVLPSTAGLSDSEPASLITVSVNPRHQCRSHPGWKMIGWFYDWFYDPQCHCPGGG